MEEKSRIEKLIADLKEYAETRFDIAVLTLTDKTAALLSSLTSMLIIGIFSLFVIFFASVAVAWLIGQHFHNLAIGFFIVAGFYLLIIIIIFLNREKWINTPIVNSILKKINVDEEE